MVVKRPFKNDSVIFWCTVLLVCETSEQGKSTDLPEIIDLYRSGLVVVWNQSHTLYIGDDALIAQVAT